MVVMRLKLVSGIVARRHAFQIVSKTGAWGLPAKADFVDLIRTDAGKIKAGSHGTPRKSAIVLDTTEAFLSDGEEKFPITHDTRR